MKIYVTIAARCAIDNIVAATGTVLNAKLQNKLSIDDLIKSTLPVKHFHIVFTVPYELNAVCLHNQRMYYDLLFAAVSQTLRSFGYTHYGVETGAVAVLHTWGETFHFTRIFSALSRQPDIP
jgi:hypothetical protein